MLNEIGCNDVPLQVAMFSIFFNTRLGGKHENFEEIVTYLLPYDLLSRKHLTSTKRNNFTLADVNADVSVFGTKPSIGKTEVHL